MTRIDETVAAAGRWLLEQQEESGGWADRPGGHVNALNTAETVISLLDSGLCKAGDEAVKEAVAYLQKHQTKSGPDQGSWPREVTREGDSAIHLPDLVRTTFAIQALYRAGVGADESPTREALTWLSQLRAAAGGWGYRRGAPPEFMPSCLALIALLETDRASAASGQQQTRDSLKWLVETHYNDGGDEERGSFGPPGPLRGVHTIYGGLVIQIARQKGIEGYETREKQAIAWLLRHPDAAIKLREEWVQIDSASNADKQGGNYGFMFMTDTLLIRLLMGSDNRGDRGSKLARSAMHSLKDKVDENSGAFYGSRVFSWSTAKAVSALCVLQKHAGSEFPDFPQRTPEYKGGKVGPVIVGLAIVLSLIGFYLTREGKFGLLEFGFFSGLMLAALVAYGAIGEKTFKELLGKLIGVVKPEAPEKDE